MFSAFKWLVLRSPLSRLKVWENRKYLNDRPDQVQIKKIFELKTKSVLDQGPPTGIKILSCSGHGVTSHLNIKPKSQLFRGIF